MDIFGNNKANENLKGIVYLVATGGKRNEKPLTEIQKEKIFKYAIKLGMPAKKIFYDENAYTSYGSLTDRLIIGTDVLPSENVDAGMENANSRMSWRCVISHELIGHREACKEERELVTMYDKDEYIRKIMDEKTYLNKLALDEAQACFRAAKLSPYLNEQERKDLNEDGMHRLKTAGIEYKDVEHKFFMEERNDYNL
jgi:hypothetical protein